MTTAAQSIAVDSRKLAPAEHEKLVECEQIITRDLKAFIEVGSALLTIRDGRLYRSTHGTFDLYVRDMFEFTMRRANQLAESASVVKMLGDGKFISQTPLREAHIRPLLKVEPKRREHIWKLAMERSKGERFTARHVKEAIRQTGGFRPVSYEPKHGKGLLPRTASDNERRKLDRLIGTWLKCGKNVRPAFQKFLEQSKSQHSNSPTTPTKL